MSLVRCINIKQGDDGIDIMAKTANGEWIALQCKALNPETTLNLHSHKIDKFLSHNNADKNQNFPLSKKIIFHTAKTTSKDFDSQIAKAQSPSCEIKVYGYYDLCENLNIDWSAFNVTNLKDSINSLKTLSKKSLRPHQEEALEKIKAHF